MVAKVLGIPKTSLGNWVRLNTMGSLGWVQGDDKAAKVSAEQRDIGQLRAENARLRMERDIAKKKPWRTSYKTRCKVRLLIRRDLFMSAFGLRLPKPWAS